MDLSVSLNHGKVAGKKCNGNFPKCNHAYLSSGYKKQKVDRESLR